MQNAIYFSIRATPYTDTYNKRKNYFIGYLETPTQIVRNKLFEKELIKEEQVGELHPLNVRIRIKSGQNQAIDVPVYKSDEGDCYYNKLEIEKNVALPILQNMQRKAKIRGFLTHPFTASALAIITGVVIACAPGPGPLWIAFRIASLVTMLGLSYAIFFPLNPIFSNIANVYYERVYITSEAIQDLNKNDKAFLLLGK